jgi:hypothetical protein
MKTDESACFKGDDDNENEDELLCYGDSDYNNILGVYMWIGVTSIV